MVKGSPEVSIDEWMEEKGAGSMARSRSRRERNENSPIMGDRATLRQLTSRGLNRRRVRNFKYRALLTGREWEARCSKAIEELFFPRAAPHSELSLS